MASLAAESTPVANTLILAEPLPAESTVLNPGSVLVDSQTNTPGTEVSQFTFSVEDADNVLPSAKLLRRREFACYAAFYIAGYKCVVEGAVPSSKLLTR